MYVKFNRGIEYFTGQPITFRPAPTGGGGDGAQEKTRTSTTLRPQAPEACASTNSATWASSYAIAYIGDEGVVLSGHLVNILSQANMVIFQALC